MPDKTVAIILGGGVGSRLYPLTSKRSKPAVPIGGKYRLIDIAISNCLNSNIRQIFVLTMFNSASLNRHIKNTYHFDHFSNGFVDILASEQTPESQLWFQGTADAVRQSLRHLENIDYNNVLILSGDQLYNMDLIDVINKHQKNKSDITIATTPVNKKDGVSFGIMKVNKKNVISDFIEKPNIDEIDNWGSDLPAKYVKKHKHYLASMGIYVFTKDALNQLFVEQPKANDFGKEIIPFAVTEKKYSVFSYIYDGYWADIGNIRSFLEENLKMVESNSEFQMYDPEKRIYTHARMLAPTKIIDTKMSNALICDGTLCYAKEVRRSIIGVRTRIGKETTIIDSIIMGNSEYQSVNTHKKVEKNQLLGIGENSHIERTIIDRDVRIEDNVTIRGGKELEDADTQLYCIRDGVIIVRPFVTIKAGTRIGIK